LVILVRGVDIRREEGGETVLSGTLVDEAALHGVLMKIRDLGLPLVEVKRLATSDTIDYKEGPAT
jgi:hypothetical protein